MEKDVIRLECLKLAVRGGQTIQATVDAAKEFEKFVLGDEESFEDLVGEEKTPKKKNDKAPKSS